MQYIDTNISVVNKWLTNYWEAWIEKDAMAIAMLFTDDCCYEMDPFHQIFRGRSVVKENFETILAKQHNLSYTFHILSINHSVALVHCTCVFNDIKTDAIQKIDGIYSITFHGGNCSILKKWWHIAKLPSHQFNKL